MPDDQYTGDGGLGFDYEDVPQAVAPPPATFGYMYGSSRYANEPPVPRPTQAQLEALPANTLTDIPGAGWAYRETVPHQERLMQLDREAQRARQAAEAAAQDAQMFAQMSRVARSVKDIEIARRSIDVMGLQRDIQNGVPIHDAVTRHPLALGSGYGSALQHTAPVTPPKWVPPSNGAPGYFQTDKGIQIPPASAMQMTPLDASLTVAKDPETGKRIGVWAQTSHGARRLVLDEAPKGLTPANYLTLYSGQERGLNEELDSVPAINALRNPKDPQHDYYVGLQQKLKEVRANRDALATIGVPERRGLSPTNSTVKRAVKNPATGKWELK